MKNNIEVPKPKLNENKNMFIKRCINDDIMNYNFPSNNDRLAICSFIYDKTKLESKIYKITESNINSEKNDK